MFKQLVCAIALSCVCNSAIAEYGFEPTAALAPDELGAVAIAVADVSGDARDDLVALTRGGFPDYDRQVVIFRQTGDGELVVAATYPYEGEPGSVLKLVDFDSDGDRDIIASHADGWMVLLNQGELQFSLSMYAAAGVGASDFEFMDVDVDGRLDIVAMSEWEGSAIYFGDGDGGFRERTALAIPGGIRLHLVDMNRDGRRDLAYARIYGEGVFVHLNQGSGFSSEYTVVPLGVSPSYVDDTLIADVDSDGIPEILFDYTQGYRSNIIVYSQRRDGIYRKQSMLRSSLLYGGFLVARDMDGDGRKDLMQTSGEDVGLHFGRSFGFSAQSRFDVDNINGDVESSVGDLNGDGLQDLAFRGSFGAVSYMLGRTAPAQADLGVYLGLGRDSVAVRVDNHSATASSDSYEITLQVDARFGPVSAGSVPPGCHDPGWSDDGIYLMCGFEGLPAGASRTFVVPITMPPRTTMNQITADARLLTFGDDLRESNDVARKRITIRPVNNKIRR